MHSAPAVSYPVGRSRFQGWLVVLTSAAGTVAGVLWHYQAHPAGWRLGLFALILLGACVAAAVAWRRTPMGNLRWDGQAWSWTSVEVSVCGAVTVHFDWQSGLVLSLRTDLGTRFWLWPERRAEVTRWNDLRRAVFSHGGATPARHTHELTELASVKS